MHLTRFLKLRKASEALDPHFISKKLRDLDRQLKSEGILLDAHDTAVTQDGIFYVEPKSGIATKVLAYLPDFEIGLTGAQLTNLSRKGYDDPGSIKKFHPYHLMRCNTLMSAAKQQWQEKYVLSRRLDGTFPFRIVEPGRKKGKEKKVYQEIPAQRLYVCENCLWKAMSILDRVETPKREEFRPEEFFDVNHTKTWNSLGELSKDFGFTRDMYPEDWLEISKLRKEQVGYHCEHCCRDLSREDLRRFLSVHPTDHVEDTEGYVRLECICIACVAELPGHEALKNRDDLRSFRDASATVEQERM